MIKQCIKCKNTKKVKEFNKNSRSKDGHSNICKPCKREYDRRYHTNRSDESKNKKYKLQQKRILNIKKWFFDYMKDKKCERCGESHIATLDFHHKGNKSFNISNGVSRGTSLKKIKEEIKKCNILCANCHRKETAKDLGWYNY